MKLRTIGLLVGMALTSVGLGGSDGGCSQQTASIGEDIQEKRVNDLVDQANSQIGIANIHNFTEKQLANTILQLRDQPNLATYTYVQEIGGKLICLGHSIGFGLPYSTQTTSPQKPVNYAADSRNPSHYDGPMPQAEPNGLYMPSDAEATWVLLIDPKTGQAHPTYVEPRITVSTFPLTGPAIEAACQ